MPTYVIQDSVFCFYGRTIGIKLLFFLILRKQNISGLVSKRIREVSPPQKKKHYEKQQRSQYYLYAIEFKLHNDSKGWARRNSSTMRREGGSQSNWHNVPAINVFLLFLNHVYIYGYMHVGMCTWMQELEEARKGNWAHQHFPGAWVAGSLLVWVMETELRTSARAVCGLNHRVISPALMSIFTRKYLNRRCPELYTN